MGTLIKFICLVCISITSVLSQQVPVGTTPIALAVSSVSASLPLYQSAIERQCVTNTNNYRSYPSGQSMENLIALIEKLENSLMNTTDANLANNINGAEKLARILLRRFRFDGYTNKTANQRKSRDDNLDKINNGFLGFPQESNSYYFPDYVYTQDELCSLFYSLSHNVINANQTQSVHFSAPLFRGKRQAYNYNNNRRQQNANPQPDPLNPHQPVISNFLVNRNTPYSIKEEGIVSFRGSKTEAIAPARVLIGVIAGLTPNIKANTADVIKEVGGRIPNGYSGKVIDPILAVTLADLWGSGTAPTNGQISPYIYGITGEWSSTTCTTHYGLSSVPTDKYDEADTGSRGTLAEIRGGIDGYLIGRSLKNLGTTDSSKLRLSTILRSYYSKPRMSKTTSATYCDRASQITNELQNTAQTYYEMNAIINGLGFPPPGSPPQEFSTALSRAQQTESSGYNEYCNRPGGTLDKTAPCETPSDVLFFIDGSSIEKLQVSSDVVNSISGNLINIRSAGGVVNIFFGSQGKNGVNPNVILPSGPGDWSLVAASFNSTDTGCSLCRINDFNTTLPQAVANTGKYFRYVNQTLFNYEWWTPRTNDSAIPAKSAVLIDLSSVTVAPDSGPDRDDYNNFKDQLRYRHRDVRYLSVATNQELFKDILRDESDKETPGTVGSPNLQLGPNLVKKICDNPATFQYNACHDRKSDNVQYVGYITPGYKQNWAMYPEFFLKSFNIRFSFKAEDGDIKVCYDRTFPPERQDEWYCKELKSGEEKIFEISNPCKGRSLWNCDPFYFTVWGKDRTLTTPCLDERCLSLDQIKFTVTHTGVQCSSSNHLLPSNTFQVIFLFIFAILYLFLNKS